MKKLLYLLFLCTAFQLQAQEHQVFEKFLQQINELEGTQKISSVEAYISKISQMPLIEEGHAIFLAKGSPSTPPYIVADFNGFLNPRYVSDRSIGRMQQIPGTAWFYLRQSLRQDAIIHYQIVRDSLPITDPLNPHVRLVFGRLVSEMLMPEAQLKAILSDHTILKRPIIKGEVIRKTFYSEILGHERTLHIYLPYSYESTEEKLPTMYFHDGTYYVERALVPEIIDSLIAREQIPPMVAVFDDPVIRGKEYRGDSSYIAYYDQELIPFIEETYRVHKSRKQRGVIGGSRGGQSALYLAHATDKFDKCAAFSPAIHPESIADFTHKLKDFSYAPTEVFLTGSIYDHIWYQDAVDLKNYFAKTERQLSYVEIAAGHNIPAWRSLLDEILLAFWGTKK